MRLLFRTYAGPRAQAAVLPGMPHRSEPVRMHARVTSGVRPVRVGRSLRPSRLVDSVLALIGRTQSYSSAQFSTRELSPAASYRLAWKGGTLSQSADFRTLAESRVREAKLLLDGSEWSGAYYLAGYAVECGLKACLTKDLQAYRMPDKDVLVKGFIHDVASLTKIANLDGPRNLEAQTDSVFALNWNVVADWNESSRYDIWTETQSRELYEAIVNADHGVLQWLRKHW